MSTIYDANMSEQIFNTTPIPTTASSPSVVLIYPAGLYTTDHAKISKHPKMDRMGWWKSHYPVIWSVLVILSDIVHFRSFAVGICYILPFFHCGEKMWENPKIPKIFPRIPPCVRFHPSSHTTPTPPLPDFISVLNVVISFYGKFYPCL